MEKPVIFNPLDKRNLGESVVNALLQAPEAPLESVPKFPGAGIYAIYYRGDFPAYLIYRTLNAKNGEVPIYVGKAVPKGGRKGGSEDSSLESTALSKRLQEHAASVKLARNLELHHFTCRYIIVDDIWIGLGETLLIQKFRPLWNQIVDGFGNHNPGGGRFEGKRPLWDELHPGREWAEKCKAPTLNALAITQLVGSYFTHRFPVAQLDPSAAGAEQP